MKLLMASPLIYGSHDVKRWMPLRVDRWTGMALYPLAPLAVIIMTVDIIIGFTIPIPFYFNFFSTFGDLGLSVCGNKSQRKLSLISSRFCNTRTTGHWSSGTGNVDGDAFLVPRKVNDMK